MPTFFSQQNLLTAVKLICDINPAEVLTHHQGTETSPFQETGLTSLLEVSCCRKHTRDQNFICLGKLEGKHSSGCGRSQQTHQLARFSHATSAATGQEHHPRELTSNKYFQQDFFLQECQH